MAANASSLLGRAAAADAGLGHALAARLAQTFCPNNCSGFPCNATTGVCQCGENPFVTPYSPVDCAMGLAYLGVERMNAYRIVHGVAYVILLAVILWSLVQSVRSAGKVIPTVKNIVYALLALIFLLRLIYFTIDPHGVYMTFPNPLGRFLFSVCFSIFFSCYSMILLLWIEICNNSTKRIRSGFLSSTRPIFIAINTILYSMELIMVIVQSLGHIVNPVILADSIFLGVTIIIYTIVSFIFGNKFLKQIRRFGSQRQEEYRLMVRKVTMLTWGVSVMLCLSLFIYFFSTVVLPPDVSPNVYLITTASMRVGEIICCGIIYEIVTRTRKVRATSTNGSNGNNHLSNLRSTGKDTAAKSDLRSFDKSDLRSFDKSDLRSFDFSDLKLDDEKRPSSPQLERHGSQVQIAKFNPVPPPAASANEPEAEPEADRDRDRDRDREEV